MVVEIEGMLYEIELDKVSIKPKEPINEFENDMEEMRTLINKYPYFTDTFFSSTMVSNYGYFYGNRTIGKILISMGYTEMVRIKLNGMYHYVRYNPHKTNPSQVKMEYKKAAI